MSGLCGCGCGQPTTISLRNSKAKGWIKGQPRPYVHGHNATKSFAYHLMNFWKKTFAGMPPEIADCVVWTGEEARNGYGLVSVKMFGTRFAHVISYHLSFGPVPKGLELDHLCRNRLCVNPYHLEPVTRLVNVRRGAKCKINEEIAAEIRNSSESRRVIARRLGISYSIVHAVRVGRTWN